MKDFRIGNRTYGFLHPFVIAEIGVNHEGDLDKAIEMIDAVAEGGADAAKFQTYKADKIAAVHSSPAYWDLAEEPTASQHELFSKYDAFGPDEYARLTERCAKRGVDFVSTPFDLEAVDLVAALSPVIKVASADLTNVPLLRRVGGKGKPVILSTGAARLDEVAAALEQLTAAGAQEIALLHCVLNYPTPPQAARLDQIDLLARAFGDRASIGYSDHVKPDPDGELPALLAAVLRGATVIEKHFTFDKSLPGNDHYHAMDLQDLAQFRRRLDQMVELFGSGPRDISGEAAAIRNARRRIIAARDIPAGTTLEEVDLIALRSVDGLEIGHWDQVVGQQAAQDIGAGAPVHWQDLGQTRR